MRTSTRSPLAFPLRAAATALALVLTAACSNAPDDTAPIEEVAPAAAALRAVSQKPEARKPEARKPEAAKATAQKPAAANAAEVPAIHGPGGACDSDPGGDCGSCDGAGDHGPEHLIGEEVERVDIRNAPTRGPANAPVTLVVFSDFQCPFSSKFAGVLDQLEQEYPGKLRLAFKHRPLPIHKQARVAARASLAAHAQGKFWEYQAALFDKAQGALDQAGLEERAADLGLDVVRFARDMRSPGLEAQVAADFEEGERLAIEGTPTLFVNGHRVMGAQPIGVLRTAIARALAGK
ncbi:DsbA family protein [Sorangium sp. KYC3313]|uniref:DsbA family protein n=1 Tax=Sorangium sp. KYC3313 TaxID=3449740 RepID=UPI003F8949ED